MIQLFCIWNQVRSFTNDRRQCPQVAAYTALYGNLIGNVPLNIAWSQTTNSLRSLDFCIEYHHVFNIWSNFAVYETRYVHSSTTAVPTGRGILHYIRYLDRQGSTDHCVIAGRRFLTQSRLSYTVSDVYYIQDFLYFIYYAFSNVCLRIASLNLSHQFAKPWSDVEKILEECWSVQFEFVPTSFVDVVLVDIGNPVCPRRAFPSKFLEFAVDFLLSRVVNGKCCLRQCLPQHKSSGVKCSRRFEAKRK
jgi:hypothetical protein